MIRFYLVEVEGTDLDLPDGPLGFIANRWVLASSPVAAEKRACALTLRNWESISGTPPKLWVVGVAPVSFLHALRSLRQNKGHAFYREE